MMLRPLVLTLASVAATTTVAHAQAPGEVDPLAPPSAAPVVAPAASNPCGGYAQVNPMATRWAIGFALGGMGVGPEDAPEGSETEFKISQISLRYRASYRFELELALFGGRQMLEDDVEGPLAAGAVTIGARYRFMPARKWNWFLSGALGGMVIANHESTEEERDAAQRPIASFGIGLERRFRRLALQIELKGFAIGPREAYEDGNVMTPQPEPAPSGEPMPDGKPIDPPSTTTTASDELTGGSFTIGASYYF